MTYGITLDWFWFRPPTSKEHLKLATPVSPTTIGTFTSPIMTDILLTTRNFFNMCMFTQKIQFDVFLKIAHVIQVCFV